MPKVIIELEFDQDEVEKEDVHKYLLDLIANDSIDWYFLEDYELISKFC